MTLQLYTNNSENIVIDKSITAVGSAIEGTMRDSLSILKPTILIAYNQTDLSYEQIMTANYFYITETGRYYYIDQSLTTVNNELISITGDVDVLMSHAAVIRSQTAIIARQENNYNLYLDDGMFRLQQKPIIQQKIFPNGFDFNYYTYVLYTAGHLKRY